MSLIPLSTVQCRLRPAAPLPWNILNGTGHVVWMRGHCPSTAEFVSLGLARELYVESSEVHAVATQACSSGSFFEQWAAWELRLSVLLRAPIALDFVPNVSEIGNAVDALVRRDSDKVLFTVLRHDYSNFAAYGVAHSMHVAAICALLAQSFGWGPKRRHSLICAALTANLSVIELQGTLAATGGRPTAAQRAVLHTHPMDSAHMLVEAGLADADWLDAVRTHHELPDGSGYPGQISSPREMAQLVHLADTFTAKYAARYDRSALPATDVVRSLNKQDDPLAARLAQILGDYPPGGFVRLSTGEAAVVTRRGLLEAPPQVAVVHDARRALSGHALRRGTVRETFITHALDDTEVLVRLDAEQLYYAASQVALESTPSAAGAVPTLIVKGSSPCLSAL